MLVYIRVLLLCSLKINIGYIGTTYIYTIIILYFVLARARSADRRQAPMNPFIDGHAEKNACSKYRGEKKYQNQRETDNCYTTRAANLTFYDEKSGTRKRAETYSSHIKSLPNIISRSKFVLRTKTLWTLYCRKYCLVAE